MATCEGTGEDGLTFDDVLLIPQRSAILPAEVDTSTQLTPGIRLTCPIVSAAMDTVTESRLAIALAREGGIGVIHRNCSIETQAAEVDKVKRSESGMIVDPITLPPDATLGQAQELMARYHISGVPITEGTRLVGILTNRDIRFATDTSHPVSEYMTSENLVVAPLNTTLDEAIEILQEHRIEKLPLVDEDYNLKGLITVKDIRKKRDFPAAAVDSQGRLLVAAAVGVGPTAKDRAEALVEAGVDMLAIDTSHGHSDMVLRAAERLKSRYPDVPLAVGNVVTGQGVRDLVSAGADVVKVGVGAGSICTTRIIAGVGVPQLTAVLNCAEAARAAGVALIADGGVRYSGDLVKALAAGSDAVMLGSVLAGHEECPGDTVLYEGRRFKEYRAMGSITTMKGYSRDRYASAQGRASGKVVPEGIDARVAYKGNLKNTVFQLVGGLRSGMGYVGAADLSELRSRARFVRITNAAFIESHPHSVIVTKEAPNYQVQPRQRQRD